MGPRIREPTGRAPPRHGRASDAPQPETEPHHEPERDNTLQTPQRNNDRLYNTLQNLSARLAILQSCSCPADCPGPDPAAAPKTPRRAARCTEAKTRSFYRQQADVLAEAWATTEVQLPRFGDTATGILRMSVQVHTDIDDKCRKGVSNAFNLLALLYVLLGGLPRPRVGAWVIGLLVAMRATTPTIVSSPQTAERLT